MAQPRIVEVDYYVLQDKLKAAVAAGTRIEQADKARWQDYIKANGIDVVTMQARAKVKFMRGKPRLVIIDEAGPWGGLFVYSKEDEVALRWDAGTGPT